MNGCAQSSSVHGAWEKCARRPAVLHMPAKKRGWYWKPVVRCVALPRKSLPRGLTLAQTGYDSLSVAVELS
jgi:hypothetical protein